MLTAASLMLEATAPAAPPTGVVGGTINLANLVAPILSTGVVGVFLLMILFRVKIMPTYVYDEAKKEWERQRTALETDNSELKRLVKDGTDKYTNQVIPVFTRSIDMNKEYLEILRGSSRGRGGPTWADTYEQGRTPGAHPSSQPQFPGAQEDRY